MSNIEMLVHETVIFDDYQHKKTSLYIVLYNNEIASTHYDVNEAHNAIISLGKRLE